MNTGSFKKYSIFGLVLVLLTCVVGVTTMAKLRAVLDVDVKTVELKEESKNLSFDLKYPEVRLLDSHVQTKINNTIKKQVYDFKKYLEDMYNEAMSTTPKELVENSASFNYTGTSSFAYEVVGDILSMRLTFTEFTGGAHPMTFVRDLNFDLKTGNVVKFKDLFNEEGQKTYKDIVDNYIRDIINKNPDDYFADQFKGIGDDVQFYLTREGVTVFYQLYDLAPYSAGIPEFKIPYSEFNGTILVKTKK